MKVTDVLKNGILFLDGGMGTLLVERGLKVGEQSEEWNMTHPTIVREIHEAYFAAGANAVSANTFGVNAYKYDDETLEKLVFSAVDNAKAAREAFCDGAPRFIALDIGPSGKMLKPFGELDFEIAVENFKKLVRAGVKAGVDLGLVET
ncbi:MAG: homocysteine S-methyltransferase family protein, partial [Clostridia bacterium]|nr:homocysteine S-methyltransferase family protein [Clostridia bacterium]